ncbi:MAG: pyruvate dehydrogenase complex dihydrolipoamide acetyltransferase [Sphingobacteriales bacterium 17-39-43]|uniref:pyruvate dehydrogenase complex dihydrolipoamide acetyltransferase n=1 Tax=Daejeonella sp. TaxID=2805397 RepID=UPI000BCE6958|nr:pyruvate dehydrogenase complex dihydrolipoamide acetyltransferase [Daejeonella sp.]OYY04878.1 MAG: pyruvate dehydrogenase complex dihydrolipoamide acetyltransferase [Sphingobacteriia bacterium 35-40-5]OYZ32534.1 MAG: pyruvate dehydrogenase complex dihydrolipoamide acetyltransferase [Sphingobacteriales bacterium 16-39-50]OYZ59563.1 MAG: pyruvate dehydrogenase complex dihydrolipoamide acetyltransferase [Sphingobacteriales bacterium 24-40-4]OZA25897.1 MAG: pyruvate dehydrogenase complex dihydro
MAEVVKMPKMSDTMTEGVIAKWHKKVGDKVSSGELIAEVETDKATMDFESFQEGTLLYIGAKEGEAAAVDSVIAILGAEGEDYQALLSDSGSQKEVSEPAKAPEAKASEEPVKESTPVVANTETNSAGSSDADAEALGATIIRMPLLSDTMTEGVIAEWHKKVGDKVKSDDALADVETDKATMEVIGYADGVLLYVGVVKGQAAKVNDIIAIVGKEGTDVSALLKSGLKPAVAELKAESQPDKVNPAVDSTSATETQHVESDSTSRLKASPLARKIAKDKGIDISQVKGSAEGGRIVKKDIESFNPAAQAQSTKASPVPAAAATASAAEKAPAAIPQFTGEEKYTEKPVSQMRKVIAKRLSESLFTSPHFYLTMSIDMDSAMQARAKINEFASVKISFNDMVLKAVAVALKQHPNVNSSWLGDKIRYNEHVNIGVAVAVEDGLLVPVVRFADGKSLSHISAEVKDFAQRAKSKKLQPSDWEGSTFTISNLGMFGIDEFTAIINPPDACILAVGGIQQVPVVKNGAVVPGNVMKVTLSCDHRVVDGATGAAFLQTLKALLEEPVRLLV